MKPPAATIIVFAAIMAALPRPTLAQDGSMLVTTDWLAERMDDPSIVVLHVGNDSSFEEARVAGARLLPLQAFAPEVNGLSTEMPEPEALRDALETAGVSVDSRIVVYSASHPPQLAARLYLTLEHFGLGANASLLDGGLRAWQAEDRPVESGAEAVVERGSLPALVPGAALLVDRDYVSARVEDGAAVVIDARDEGFWTGEQWLQARAERAGRVPGALNVPFRTLVDDSGRILSTDALARRFEEAGVASGSPVVVYCHVGQQASLVALGARLLGHEVRLYDGSYEEWSSQAELPVALD